MGLCDENDEGLLGGMYDCNGDGTPPSDADILGYKNIDE